jgi:hypothetical protein
LLLLGKGDGLCTVLWAECAEPGTPSVAALLAQRSIADFAALGEDFHRMYGGCPQGHADEAGDRGKQSDSALVSAWC